MCSACISASLLLCLEQELVLVVNACMAQVHQVTFGISAAVLSPTYACMTELHHAEGMISPVQDPLSVIKKPFRVVVPAGSKCLGLWLLLGWVWTGVVAVIHMLHCSKALSWHVMSCLVCLVCTFFSCVAYKHSMQCTATWVKAWFCFSLHESSNLPRFHSATHFHNLHAGVGTHLLIAT